MDIDEVLKKKYVIKNNCSDCKKEIKSGEPVYHIKGKTYCEKCGEKRHGKDWIWSGSIVDSFHGTNDVYCMDKPQPKILL